MSDADNLILDAPPFKSLLPYLFILLLGECALGGLTVLIGPVGAVVLTGSLLVALWLTSNITAYLYLLPFFIGAPFRLLSSLNVRVNLLNLILFMIFVVVICRSALSGKSFSIYVPKRNIIIFFILSIGLSILGAQNQIVGIYQLLKILIVLSFVYVFVYNLSKSVASIRKLLYAVILAGVISAFNGIFENYFLTGAVSRVEGVRIFAGAGGGYGAFVGIALSFAFASVLYERKRPKVRLLCLLSFLPLITALILSQTRAWILGSVIAGFFLLYNKVHYKLSSRKKIVILFCLLLLLITFLGQVRNISSFLFIRGNNPAGLAAINSSYNDASLLQRFQFWYLGWESFIKNPLTGAGLGNIRFKGWKLAEPTGLNEEGSLLGFTDNHYIGVLAETGIVGALGWILLIITILKSARTITMNMTDWQQNMILSGISAGLIVLLIGALFWNLTTSTIDSSRLFLLIAMLFSLEKIVMEQVKPRS